MCGEDKWQMVSTSSVCNLHKSRKMGISGLWYSNSDCIEGIDAYVQRKAVNNTHPSSLFPGDAEVSPRLRTRIPGVIPGILTEMW
ncbi:hypothetical protein X798_04889 [Onchocerca flexuosa]|uniref:SCP domain-containing protein n=2 Tax=Onchocerca flexuosa TaxID=387005 RepID=A0A183I273_9BILA|nr:hypothetical protein X798_04889 [Onchocerca flexuosa]VDP14782.1 unnamed protein product [Onchocerca flexuosa]